MRLTFHNERLSSLELQQVKIDIVADTVAELTVSKSASEERKLRLNPQDREEWAKKTDEQKVHHHLLCD